ncbi:hypothetical protein HPB50_019946 [Hyalomma asiaticum]|uniref:Uncharacterized protein n=1 Tax=Hyalomma asiaticum TaxID=266040 RepID=A0ACB7T0F6_HYAAI|nr:hypothetical protein HPB50_019946 [Hyalomma asiaticum]
MAAETVITQSRKRVRLEQQSTSGPLVSLQAILSLANETQRCVNEGEATFNAGHVVCCGIKSSTDTEVSVESLCLQTSAIKGPPHCVNVTVRQDTGSVKFAGLDLNSGSQGNKTGPSRYVPPHLRNNRSVLPGPPQGNAQGYGQKSYPEPQGGDDWGARDGYRGDRGGGRADFSNFGGRNKRNDGPIRNNAFPPRQ